GRWGATDVSCGVISYRIGLSAPCPVYPRQRPNCGPRWWSVSCQNRKLLTRRSIPRNLSYGWDQLSFRAPIYAVGGVCTEKLKLGRSDGESRRGLGVNE